MSSQDTRLRATSSQNPDDMMQYLQWPDDQDPSATHDGGRPSNPASAANAGPAFGTDHFSVPSGKDLVPYLDGQGGRQIRHRETTAAPRHENETHAFSLQSVDMLPYSSASVEGNSQYVDWTPGAVGASYYNPGFESGGPSNHPSDDPQLPWIHSGGLSAMYGMAPGQGGGDTTGHSQQQSGWWRYLEDGTRVWVPAVGRGQAGGREGSGQGTTPDGVEEFGLWVGDDNERLEPVDADLGPRLPPRPSSASSSDTSVIGESVIGESSVNLDGIGQRNLANYMGQHSA